MSKTITVAYRHRKLGYPYNLKKMAKIGRLVSEHYFTIHKERPRKVKTIEPGKNGKMLVRAYPASFEKEIDAIIHYYYLKPRRTRIRVKRANVVPAYEKVGYGN